MSEGKRFLSAMVFIEKENKKMLGRNIEIIAGIRVTCFQGEKTLKTCTRDLKIIYLDHMVLRSFSLKTLFVGLKNLEGVEGRKRIKTS